MPIGTSDGQTFKDEWEAAVSQLPSTPGDDELSNYQGDPSPRAETMSFPEFVDKATHASDTVKETWNDLKTFMDTGDPIASFKTAFNFATGGVVTAPLREAGLGIFGGRMAPELRTIAERLEANDAKPSEIKRITGLERGVEGMWRHEIPDIGANVKPDAIKDLDVDYLGNVFEHPEFFKAYPEADRVIIYTDKDLASKYDNARAVYHQPSADYPEGAIGITPELGEYQTTSDILHELQHYVQTKEGITPLNKQDVPEDLQDMVKLENLRDSKTINDIQEKAKTYGWSQDRVKQELINRGVTEDFANKMLKSLDYEVYHALGTEVEARNVSHRMNMTPDEARNTLATKTEDVPRENQIYEDPVIKQIVRDRDSYYGSPNDSSNLPASSAPKEPLPIHQTISIKETSPDVWKVTYDGRVLGDSRGYSKSQAVSEAQARAARTDDGRWVKNQHDNNSTFVKVINKYKPPE